LSSLIFFKSILINCFSSPKSKLLIYGGEAFKIGITNKSVSERFNLSDLEKIEILYQWYFENGEECFNMEKKILKEHAVSKWKGRDLLSSGNSELFKYDILDFT
jgi:hypothetical protein